MGNWVSLRASLVVLENIIIQFPLSGIQIPFLVFSTKILVTKECSRTFLVYLVIRFVRISYGRFIAIRYEFKLSTFVQEPLVKSRRCYLQGFKREKRLAANNGGG